MKAVVLAYHSIGCVGIEQLIKNGFEIEAVFTHADDPNENLWFGSVAEVAAKHGLEVFAPQDINHPLWVKRIQDIKPDVIFSFYYRNLIKKEVLDIPRIGCFNLHGSLLPAYRGRCPANWVLVNGETETGVTLHKMTVRADDGEIISQKSVGISDDDTAFTLQEKLTEAAESLLAETLPQIKSETFQLTAQDASKASYFGGRKPADGRIDWNTSGREIRNLIRAVTKPYPGAFTHVGDRKCLIWEASVEKGVAVSEKGGTVLSLNPFVVATGDGALRIESGQVEGGLFLSGSKLTRELGLNVGARLDMRSSLPQVKRKKGVLILGVNGFIGNALSKRLLESDDYEVYGMDLHSSHVDCLLHEPNFHFREGDISISREWVEYHVRKCDVILPLVAIATPIEYTRNPIGVFELDFEENLRIIRDCLKYNKRLIFPSTSEVYGMCAEEEFNEDTSNLVLGPINKQRWIYSCIKQLLDRVIWAYGQRDGLKFSLFRPFNWIGPRLDSLNSARVGSSRAITQLILNLVEGTPIKLIDGGAQKRCFTDISDGVECLFRIIENKRGNCDGKIFNIGNPTNEASIKELALMLVSAFEDHPLAKKFPPVAPIVEVESASYYGEGYQDVSFRRPSIRNAQRYLGWQPKVSLEQSVKDTLDFFISETLSVENVESSSNSAGKKVVGLKS